MHLESHLVSLQRRDIHLADGSGGKRFAWDVVKDISQLALRFFAEDPLCGLKFERGNAIEQVEEFVAVLDRNQVRLESHHLAELKKAPADRFEELAQTAGSGGWGCFAEEAPDRVRHKDDEEVFEGVEDELEEANGQ